MEQDNQEIVDDPMMYGHQLGLMADPVLGLVFLLFSHVHYSSMARVFGSWAYCVSGIAHLLLSLPNEMKHSTLCIVQEKNKQHPNLQLSEQKTLFLGQ